jgi:hypothetical protein
MRGKAHVWQGQHLSQRSVCSGRAPSRAQATHRGCPLRGSHGSWFAARRLHPKLLSTLWRQGSRGSSPQSRQRSVSGARECQAATWAAAASFTPEKCVLTLAGLPPRRRAVVCGSGVAGLAAARVLADHFDEVGGRRGGFKPLAVASPHPSRQALQQQTVKQALQRRPDFVVVAAGFASLPRQQVKPCQEVRRL